MAFHRVQWLTVHCILTEGGIPFPCYTSTLENLETLEAQCEKVFLKSEVVWGCLSCEIKQAVISKKHQDRCYALLNVIYANEKHQEGEDCPLGHFGLHTDFVSINTIKFYPLRYICESRSDPA